MATLHRNSTCGLILALLVLTACSTERRQEVAAARLDESQKQVSQGYALLYDLVSRNKDVSKILILKSVSPEGKQLIDDIAAACTDATHQLETYAKTDPTLHLKDMGLPHMEQATRDAIDKAKSKELLLAHKSTFERDLLLTQSESMNYGKYLAGQVAAADTDPERKAWLNSLGEQFSELLARVVERLTTR